MFNHCRFLKQNILFNENNKKLKELSNIYNLNQLSLYIIFPKNFAPLIV